MYSGTSIFTLDGAAYIVYNKKEDYKNRAFTHIGSRYKFAIFRFSLQQSMLD